MRQAFVRMVLAVDALQLQSPFRCQLEQVAHELGEHAIGLEKGSMLQGSVISRPPGLLSSPASRSSQNSAEPSSVGHVRRQLGKANFSRTAVRRLVRFPLAQDVQLVDGE
ncbi:hypothetical protein [Nocardia sp. NPDC047038]|uniref:hypothetical protein n=1 Tax=Nocardia sp. NPDC047038 TaxID=3154338 RepID=UPI0033C5FED0